MNITKQQQIVQMNSLTFNFVSFAQYDEISYDYNPIFYKMQVSVKQHR